MTTTVACCESSAADHPVPNCKGASKIPKKSAVTASPAKGLDATKYHEAAAEDVVPILLPWSTEKKAIFSFSGDSYSKR